MSRQHQAPKKDFRNYTKEAIEMVAKLTDVQCYDLYEVVNNELRKYQAEERIKELEAVKKVIEARPYLDKDRLHARARGYKSSMAADARAKDGQTRPNKKKV